MLPKKFRLTVNEFYRYPQKSKKIKSLFGFIFIKLTVNIFPRFAVTVPKSIDKRAVCRHQSRRIIIEAIRKQISRLKKNVDVLIRVNKILKKQDREGVEKEIKKIFQEV